MIDNLMKYLIALLFMTCTLSGHGQKLTDCSSCSKQVLKANHIKDLSIDEIRYLTNDLFARKGYAFQDADIDAYYAGKEWYKPVNANYTIEYSAIENQNIKLLQDRTKVLQGQRKLLIAELKKFKALVEAGNQQQLKTQFNYSLGQNDDFIKNVLDELFLDDIHWFKKEGLSSVTKDNGDMVKVYALKINDDRIVFEFGLQRGSSLGTLYPREQVTEASYLYNFSFKNQKLRFEEIIVAG